MRALWKAVLALVVVSAFLSAEPLVPTTSDAVVAAQAQLWQYHRWIIFDWCSGGCEGGMCCQLVIV